MTYLGNFGDIDFLAHDGLFIFDLGDRFKVIKVENLYELLAELDHDRWRVWLLDIPKADVEEYFTPSVAAFIGVEGKAPDAVPVEFRIRAILDYWGPDRWLEEELATDQAEEVLAFLRDHDVPEAKEEEE